MILHSSYTALPLWSALYSHSSSLLFNLYNSASAPAKTAPKPSPATRLVAAPPVDAAAAEVVETAADEAEDSVVLAAAAAVEEVAMGEEVVMTEEVVTAKAELDLLDIEKVDEAVELEAHVAAVGMLVTPAPAQRESANLMVVSWSAASQAVLTQHARLVRRELSAQIQVTLSDPQPPKFAGMQLCAQDGSPAWAKARPIMAERAMNVVRILIDGQNDRLRPK